MTAKVNQTLVILLCLLVIGSFVVILISLFFLQDCLNLPQPRSKYFILKDYIQPDEIHPRWNITLTTQASPEFLFHVRELSSRWDSAISVAVYAPGSDFKLAYHMVQYLRKCDENVRKKVVWHFVFDKKYPPELNGSLPAQLSLTLACDCDISMTDCMAMQNVQSNFRQNNQLTYPINIVRNVARTAAKTAYVLASDIELYPSVGMAAAFFDLLAREHRGQFPSINPRTPHVYTLPVFEIKEGLSPPETKKELIQQFNAGNAIFFHKHICDECQDFPNRSIWIKQEPKDASSVAVFSVVRRTRERKYWEPIYISNNQALLYDERLSWEGKLDKMGQMTEMCLLGYELVILDNAFLVHAPGIKYHSKDDDKSRQEFMRINYRIHVEIEDNLRQKYEPNDCL